MNKLTFSLLIAAFLYNIPYVQAADQFTPKQLTIIESLQHRADKLAIGELTGMDSYHLAKARAWLDLATSEYYEKDTTGSLKAAIEQATTLIDALEKKQSDISMDTPTEIPGSEAVRPDLLQRIALLKKHDKFNCGQRQIAEAEVYLVWAGHELHESGKSHAESYIRNVENMIYNGEVAIDKCMEVIPPPVMEKITLSSDALFAFGKATLNPTALARLDKLAEDINKMTGELEQIILIGHTDRLRSDGHPERNQILSEQRAESIKQYLVSKGVSEEMIHASGSGSSQPLVECSNKQSRKKQIACLQPNRRVEIILRGNRKAGNQKTDSEKTIENEGTAK